MKKFYLFYFFIIPTVLHAQWSLERSVNLANEASGFIGLPEYKYTENFDLDADLMEINISAGEINKFTRMFISPFGTFLNSPVYYDSFSEPIIYLSFLNGNLNIHYERTNSNIMKISSMDSHPDVSCFRTELLEYSFESFNIQDCQDLSIQVKRTDEENCYEVFLGIDDNFVELEKIYTSEDEMFSPHLGIMKLAGSEFIEVDPNSLLSLTIHNSQIPEASDLGLLLGGCAILFAYRNRKRQQN